MTALVTETSIRRFPTSASPDSTLGGTYDEGWEKVVKDLAEWAYDPDQLVDDGLVAPSILSCFQAHQLAKMLQSKGHQAPSFVVPSGAGGFIFEWRMGPGSARTLELKPDGSQEERHFMGNKIQPRRS